MVAKARRQPLPLMERLLPLMRRRESWLVVVTIAALAVAAWLLYEPFALLLAKAFDARTWILSFGSQARVLQPEPLAREIAEQLAEARARYA